MSISEYRHACVWVFLCMGVPGYGHASVWVFLDMGTPVYGCSCVWVFLDMGPPVYGCSCVWVFLCMNIPKCMYMGLGRIGSTSFCVYTQELCTMCVCSHWLQIKASRKDLAAVMVTYPSTYGVFEETIVELCDMVHHYGGQVGREGGREGGKRGRRRERGEGWGRGREGGREVLHVHVQ